MFWYVLVAIANSSIIQLLVHDIGVILDSSCLPENESIEWNPVSPWRRYRHDYCIDGVSNIIRLIINHEGQALLPIYQLLTCFSFRSQSDLRTCSWFVPILARWSEVTNDPCPVPTSEHSELQFGTYIFTNQRLCSSLNVQQTDDLDFPTSILKKYVVFI